jgi:hypothetical protein
MAVAEFTSYTTNAEQTVYAHACMIKSIEIFPHPQQVNTVFLQLFNSADPDLGAAEAADMVIPIPSVTRGGRGTAAKFGNVSYGGQGKQKIIFPNGGLSYDTACTLTVSTTSTAYTAATTTSLPALVRVNYAPMA